MTKLSDVLKQAQGMGMDELDAGQSMPIIKILQKTGAEIDETHEDYQNKKVEGAKAGHLYFMADQELLGESVEILPLSQKTLYAEWRPKTAGGGLVGHHEPTIVTNDRYRKGDGENKNREYLGENELRLTIYFFVLFKSKDGWKKAIMPFTSSNLKHGRSLAKQIRSFSYEDKEVKPFIFSRSFTVKTKLERGHGNSWYEFNILPARILDFKADEELLKQCVEAHQDAVASLPSTAERKELTVAEEETPY